MGSVKYDITDNLHFSSSARFAQSLTRDLPGRHERELRLGSRRCLTTRPRTARSTRRWTTEPGRGAAVLANPAAFANPSFIAHGAAGAQHPVPVQMAILLNSRAANPNFNPLTAGWVMETYPLNSFGRRATENTNTAWQIEAGLTYDAADQGLDRLRSTTRVASPRPTTWPTATTRWPAGAAWSRPPTTVATRTCRATSPTTVRARARASARCAVPCTSGFYETIFNGDAVPSADCQYAVQAPLQTRTQNQQDIFELNLQGGLFDLPAGELRAAPVTSSAAMPRSSIRTSCSRRRRSPTR